MRCGVSDAKAGDRRFCTGRTAKAASGGRCSLSPSSLPLTHGVSAFGPRAVGSSPSDFRRVLGTTGGQCRRQEFALLAATETGLARPIQAEVTLPLEARLGSRLDSPDREPSSSAGVTSWLPKPAYSGPGAQSGRDRGPAQGSTACARRN